MKFKTLIFSCLMALPVLAMAHKFYVSIAEGHRKPDSIQLSVKLFTDDLEAVIQKRFEEGFKIESESADSLLNIYIAEELRMFVADSTLQMKYVGREVQYDVVWVYVEFPYAKPIQNLKIENWLLFDYNEEQANIVNIKDRKGYLESYMFTTERKTHTFNLNE